MKASLIVLAGGLGSRYNGQKQIDGVGPNQEMLMEYALYDAIQAGIGQIIFIINDLFPNEIKTYLTEILEAQKIEVHFLTQKTNAFVNDEYLSKIENRKKPMGTAQAVLMAKELIKTPFITMNADDFYGRKTFIEAVNWLSSHEENQEEMAMMAFQLSKTLSDNGSVSRGICTIENETLKKVEEHTNIREKDHHIFGEDEKKERKELNRTDLVSMNFWILKPDFFELAEELFQTFLQEMKNTDKDEFYLPTVVDAGIHTKKWSVKAIETHEHWFGMTYPEDKEKVKKFINKLINNKVYPAKLWAK